MGEMVRAGAVAGIFDKLEPELDPHKNGPAPQQRFTDISHGQLKYKYLWFMVSSCLKQ
jgi:hypothetical protein